MPERTRLRILLADDHVMVRDGLKRLIEDEPDMEVVAEATNGKEALQTARDTCPQIALIDISMPGDWDGVTLAQRLREECPSVAVVALTRHDEGAFVERMQRAGALGYVLKQSAATELVNAIRAVAAGQSYVDPAVRRSLRVAHPPAPVVADPATHTPLSADEEQVLRLMALSYSTHEIVARMASTSELVQAHRASALQKLGVSKRIDVVRYARARGWAE